MWDNTAHSSDKLCLIPPPIRNLPNKAKLPILKPNHAHGANTLRILLPLCSHSSRSQAIIPKITTKIIYRNTMVGSEVKYLSKHDSNSPLPPGKGRLSSLHLKEDRYLAPSSLVYLLYLLPPPCF